MRIVITNVVSLNAGDGAILLGLLKIVRLAFPDAKIEVMDSDARTGQRLYPEIDFEQLGSWDGRGRLARLRRKLVKLLPAALRIMPEFRNNARSYRKADLVISTGGTYVVEHYNLQTRFAHLRIAIESGAKLVMFTQSLGPFNKPENVRWLQRWVPSVSIFLLRDQLSARNLYDIGAIPQKSLVVPDAAFALADLQDLSSGSKREFSSGPRIAVSVRSWKHFRSGSSDQMAADYRQAIAAAVSSLVQHRGATVTFMSTCQGVPEYWTDDSAEAAAIIDLLPEQVRKHVDLDRSFRRAEVLLEELKSYDLVIATRMHMAILSLCACTPVFPIAYEFKTAELFHGLGLGEYVVNIEDAKPATLPGQLEHFITDLPKLRGALMESIRSQHDGAMRVSGELRRLFARNRSVAYLNADFGLASDAPGPGVPVQSGPEHTFA